MNTNQLRYNEEQRAKAEVRRVRVRRMRAAGLTWAEIGKLLGVTRARAHQLGRELRS